MALMFNPLASHADSPERLSESFCDPSWLSRNELNASTVLTYLSLSPFWSPGCINDRARSMDAVSAAELTGIEYRILPGSEATAAQGLFVIERIMRKDAPSAGAAAGGAMSPTASGGASASGSGGASAVLSLYYCLNGTIYQSPDLATLLSARIERASTQLAKAMKAMELARVAASAAAAGSSSASSSLLAGLTQQQQAPPSSSALAKLGHHDPRVDELLRFSNY